MRLLLLAALAGVFLLGAGLWLSPSGDDQEVTETVTPEVVAGGGSSEGGPVFTIIDVNTYDVSGTTEQEILASMRARGPKANGSDFFGLTETQFAYRYWKNDDDDGNGCYLNQIRIDLAVTVTLPKWDAPREAPRDLRRDWARFESALRRHEDGHREIAEWGAREIYHVLANLRTPTCDRMDAAARRASERLREVAEQRQGRFDRLNGHGRKQGAFWPQSARSMARR